MLPTVWALEASRAGDRTQVVALAEALRWPFELKSLARAPFDVLKAPPFTTSLDGLTDGARAALAPPWPDLVISAGREMEPVAKWIKQASGGRSRLVHLGRPWADIRAYDLVVTTPQYRLPRRPNVLENDVPMHRVTGVRLADEAANWRWRLGRLPRPWIGVLVGGRSRPYRFTPETARRLAREAGDLARSLGGSLLITTSPRTPAAAADALVGALDVPAFVHRWSRSAEVNPFYGILGLADKLVVTADSISMLGEACATGKPVWMFDTGEGDGAMRRPGRLPLVVKEDFFPKPRPADAFSRLVDGLAPARAGRDLRLVHRRLLSSGRAAWLGDAEPAGDLASLDLERTLMRVRRLVQAGQGDLRAPIRLQPVAELAFRPAIA